MKLAQKVIRMYERDDLLEAKKSKIKKKLNKIISKGKKKDKTKKSKKVSSEDMERLASETGLTFDGGDDNRLFAETIMVNTPEMSKSEYDSYEKDLNSVDVKGDGFEIYAWNDVSGYDYWSEEGEYNYIQVTVLIKDADKVDSKKLKSSVEDVVDDMTEWEM